MPVPDLPVTSRHTCASECSSFGSSYRANGAVEYPTMTSAAIKILRTEGPSAFYKGTAVTAARITLGFPISFVAFEAVASAFQNEIR